MNRSEGREEASVSEKRKMQRQGREEQDALLNYKTQELNSNLSTLTGI